MTGPSSLPLLRSRTVALPDSPDLTRLLLDPSAVAGAGAGPRCVWLRQGAGLIGWGCAARVDTRGPDRFAQADRWWTQVSSDAVNQDPLELPGSGAVAFGSFSFSADSAAGASLIVPSVVIGRRGETTWLTHIVDTRGAYPARDLPDPLVTWQPSQASHESHEPCEPGPTGTVTFSDGALSGPQWAQAVADAVARIADGELDKVVLARDLYAQADSPIDRGALLTRLAQQYERTWVFEVDHLVGATPEMLVRLERGLVTSRVLAGTIRRTGDDPRDLALAASLAHSSKDLEEHEYAVQSVAQALAPHCTSMAVPETPFVVHLPNVMHLGTDVAGRLRNGVTSLGLAAALHPSAAVCGTPRPVAQQLIAQLEQMDRRRYAGPVGWTDSTGDGEWGIALRCGEVDAQDPARMRLFAGCGIVAGSDPTAELAESDAKLLPMRSALQG